MKRQVGAHALDIDTMAGKAKFSLLKSQLLDFSTIADSFDSAGYDLQRLEALVEARVVHEDGKAYAVLMPTGQRILLGNKSPILGNDKRVLTIEAPFDKSRPQIK